MRDYWATVDAANDLRRYDEFEEHMNKTTFTPGPWHLGPWHKDSSVAIHSHTASIFHLQPFGTSLKACKANARLIAAAPRMYAFIHFCAAAGDAEAKAILEEIG